MEKGQALRFDVVLFHLLGKGAGEVGLAVALHEIELGLLLVYHIVDSRGDGALAVEGGGVRIRVHIRSLNVNVIVADIAAAFAALHDQAVVGDALAGVLLGKSGIDIWVLFRHLNVVGQTFVFAQQVFDHIVFFAGLNDPIDGHILLKIVDHDLCVAGNGVELAGADVIVGHGLRQRRGEHIHRDQNRQYDGRDDQ